MILKAMSRHVRRGKCHLRRIVAKEYRQDICVHIYARSFFEDKVLHRPC